MSVEYRDARQHETPSDCAPTRDAASAATPPRVGPARAPCWPNQHRQPTADHSHRPPAPPRHATPAGHAWKPSPQACAHHQDDRDCQAPRTDPAVHPLIPWQTALPLPPCDANLNPPHRPCMPPCQASGTPRVPPHQALAPRASIHQDESPSSAQYEHRHMPAATAECTVPPRAPLSAVHDGAVPTSPMSDGPPSASGQCAGSLRVEINCSAPCFLLRSEPKRHQTTRAIPHPPWMDRPAYQSQTGGTQTPRQCSH